MLDLTLLNDHSRQFATRLFRVWPQWYRWASFDPHEDFEKEALLVEVPRPVDDSRHGLFITTSEWEISIGFGESYHTRFGSDGSTTTGNFYDQAMGFLADFVAERVVVAVAYQQNEWLGAWTIDLTRESLADLSPDAGEIVMIRSWLGTHDHRVAGHSQA